MIALLGAAGAIGGSIAGALIMDDSRLQRLIGPLAKTSYEEGLRRTLQAQKEGSIHAR